jgi:hypothetical protein
MRLNATKLGSIANSRSFGDQLFDLAGQVPNLDLNFAGTKTLDPRVTFTRASTGTYVGSDGLVKTATTNEARFDHNPTTGESLGLLVEEARTNLLLRSEEFDNASWAKSSVTVSANAAISPDGNVSADLITDSSTSIEHFLDQTCSTTTNQAYTQVIYAKAGTAPSFRIMVVAIGSSSITSTVIFTQTAGVIVAGGIAGLITSATATLFNNGWYRCAITYTLNGTVTTHQMRIYPYLAGVYAGTGLGTFFWGAQLEVGAFATSYIPTTTATVTRAADVASITGSNFSSWYNQTEGTVFGQFLRTASTNSQQGRVFSFNDGTNTNALEIYQTGASNPSAQITATTAQALWTPSGFTVGTSIKEVLGYQLNNSNASFNGSAETLDTACNIPTVTQARIGDRQDGVRNLNGTIRRLTYWPVRLANPTLQAITQP